jgi:nucleolin
MKKSKRTECSEENVDLKVVVEPKEIADDADEREDDGAKRKRKRQRTRKPKAEIVSATPSIVSSALVSTAVHGTVYVEGISYDAEDADLKAMFEQIGAVVEVRMPRWHDSNKPRGFAHIVFKDSKHVPIAISQLNGQRLMGRYLTVALPKALKTVPSAPSAPPPEGCNTLFVKNLPYDCDEAAVRVIMMAFGDVKDIRLAAATNKSGDTRLKGFGYIQFASEVGTKRAASAARDGKLAIGMVSLFFFRCWLEIIFNNYSSGGRLLQVDYDAVGAKPKGSFRRTDGKLWNADDSR